MAFQASAARVLRFKSNPAIKVQEGSKRKADIVIIFINPIRSMNARLLHPSGACELTHFESHPLTQ